MENIVVGAVKSRSCDLFVCRLGSKLRRVMRCGEKREGRKSGRKFERGK